MKAPPRGPVASGPLVELRKGDATVAIRHDMLVLLGLCQRAEIMSWVSIRDTVERARK